MISDIAVSEDAAGFPIVSWYETRGLHSPEALGRARVECRIMKDAGNGALMFVARGSVRHGGFEEGKPWELLHSFAVEAAAALYNSKTELVLREQVAAKSKSGKVLWHDGAQVITADFLQDTPLHINCADASYVDLQRLNVVLTNAFVRSRNALVADKCHEMYRWPVDSDDVMTYDPGRTGWENSGGATRSGLWSTLTAVSLVLGSIALAFWLVGIL